MPLLANASVSFERTTPTGTSTAPASGTIPVHVVRVNGLGKPEPWMLGFDWVVRWDSGLTYADGSQVLAGDDIVWSELTNGRATIQKVQKVYGILACSRAVFKETE